jgi:L-lactate utilization protein LutC
VPSLSDTAVGPSSETGDRAAFLARIRGRLAGGMPANLAHPLPPSLEAVPLVHSSLLDPDDLPGSFVRNARSVRAVVHEVDADVLPTEFLAELVQRHRVRVAVVSREHEAQAAAKVLEALGVEVRPVSKDASAEADLGVTSAVAAIATTGTLVQDAHLTGGRTASLLPPVHLCVLPAARIVPTSAEVLRHLGQQDLPSNIVLITGPSRSGDIEQTMALGVHGPPVVEIAVLLGPGKLTASGSA